MYCLVLCPTGGRWMEQRPVPCTLRFLPGQCGREIFPDQVSLVMPLCLWFWLDYVLFLFLFLFLFNFSSGFSPGYYTGCPSSSVSMCLWCLVMCGQTSISCTMRQTDTQGHDQTWLFYDHLWLIYVTVLEMCGKCGIVKLHNSRKSVGYCSTCPLYLPLLSPLFQVNTEIYVSSRLHLQYIYIY